MKPLKIVHKSNGTFLQNSVGIVASMEAGYQQTRDEHAAEIQCAVNNYPALLETLDHICKHAHGNNQGSFNVSADLIYLARDLVRKATA